MNYKMNYKKLLLITCTTSIFFANPLLAEQKDKIYATVDGNPIKASDIAVLLKDPRIQFDSLPPENKKQVLDQLIDRKLLAANALKTDIVKSTEYKSTLKDTIDKIKEDLALQMWISNLSKEIAIKDKDTKKFYEKNKSKFQQPEQFKANHILVKSEEEAKKIIETLQGKENLKTAFETLAKEKSTGPSGKNGGDLGWFNADQMVPEFSLATSFLKKGTITKKPVKTEFGYHVIYLDDKKDAGDVDFESAKENIKQILAQEEFKKRIENILAKAKTKAKIIIK